VCQRHREIGSGTRKAEKRGWKQGHEWVTTIEAVSAAGRALPPLVIFKGAKLVDIDAQDDGQFRHWRIECSNKRWTSSHVRQVWLDSIFVPHLWPLNPARRRLLIVDGRISMFALAASTPASLITLKPMILPAYTSHLTQPLDVGVFSSLSSEVDCPTKRLLDYNCNGHVSRFLLFPILAEARVYAMNPLTSMRAGAKQACSPAIAKLYNNSFFPRMLLARDRQQPHRQPGLS
jgi:hypothetical protein